MPLVSLIRTKDYYSVFKEHQAVLRPAKVKAKATRSYQLRSKGLHYRRPSQRCWRILLGHYGNRVFHKFDGTHSNVLLECLRVRHYHLPYAEQH